MYYESEETTHYSVVDKWGNAVSVTTTVNGWSALERQQQAKLEITNPGGAFQLVETYSGPGLSNVTTIQRVTEIEQITDTISTFSQ